MHIATCHSWENSARLERRRVVEDDEASGEEHAGDGGSGDRNRRNREWVKSRSHSRMPRLPSCRGGEHAEGEQNRAAEDEEWWGEHHQSHVLDHVGAEVHEPVDGRPSAGHPDQHDASGQPADQTVHRPFVAATPNPDEPPEVEAGEHPGEQ